jgi:HSP20 family protein
MRFIQYSNPVRNLSGFQDGLDRTFGSIFRNYNDEVLEGTWLPAADITETDDQFEIKAELPGLKKEDVKINLVDNVLTIRGEKKTEQDEKNKYCHRMERIFGSFIRSFSLGTKVDNSKIKAEFKDGVLTLALPKAAESKPRQIEVQ